MKRATLSAILSVIMLNLFVLGLACAQTQPPPQPAPLNNQAPPSNQTLSLEEQDKIAKKDHKLRPLIDSPGTDCLDYQVDVVKLTANNTQMFWKQSDCIRIHVTNNPFLFKWSISVDETKIPEDDLSPLTKALGVNVSTANSTGTSADTPAKDSGAAQVSAQAQAKDLSVKLAGDNVALAEYAATPSGKKSSVDIPAMRSVVSEIVIAGSRGDLNSMQDAAKGLNQVKGLAREQGEVKANQPDAAVLLCLEHGAVEEPCIFAFTLCDFCDPGIANNPGTGDIRFVVERKNVRRATNLSSLTLAHPRAAKQTASYGFNHRQSGTA